MPTALTLTTADNAESWPVTVPTKWADVPMFQFVHLYGVPNQHLAPAEILCNLPAGTLERLSVQAVTMLAILLDFANDPADVLELLPTPSLPDVGSMSYGSLSLVQQRVSAEPEATPLSHMAYILAIYRMEMLWGKYDPVKVLACEAALLLAPCTEVYPDASAFLSSWSNSLKGTNPTKTTTPNPSQRSTKRAVTNWANALARCFRSMWQPAGIS